MRLPFLKESLMDNEAPDSTATVILRGQGGRFTSGPVATDPHADDVTRFRGVLLATVTSEDIEAVVTKLVDQAKSGDLRAAKLLLDAVLGRPSRSTGTNVLIQNNNSQRPSAKAIVKRMAREKSSANSAGPSGDT